MKKLGILLLLAAFCLPGTIAATAQAAYPERPITVIIPFGAGSGADRIFRILQPYMEEALGQKVVPNYKDGGGGVVGANYFMTSKPDGYTLLFYNQPHIALQETFQRVSYGCQKLYPLLGVTWRPDIITVREDSPFKTFQELLDYARQNPGRLTIGNTGSYSSNHLTYALLTKLANVSMTRVPFESGGKMNAALLGGQIDACVSNMQWVTIHKGKLRVLASGTETRPLPDVPTFAELGFPQLMGISAINILYAKPDTPKPILDFLKDKLGVLTQNAAMRDEYIREGIDWGAFDHDQMEKYTADILQRVQESKAAILESAK